MAATDPHDDPIGETEQPFLSHLMEVRDRLMRMLAAILVVFLALTPFANKLYTLLADPLMRHMPENSSMIAIEVASPFLIPFKLALVLAIFICVPYLLYQIWGFIAPGLYRHERRLAIPVLVSSTILFYLGGLFAYYVVFPQVLSFCSCASMRSSSASISSELGGSYSPCPAASALFSFRGMKCLAIKIPSSNNIHMGIANRVCEITSGGVSSIPSTKAPTIT